MLAEGQIVLRSPVEKDILFIAKLANNKKVWDNLRDYFPHPDHHQFCRYHQRLGSCGGGCGPVHLGRDARQADGD